MSAGDGSRAVVVVVCGDAEVVLGRIVATPVDLALVEALARLQLAAARFGCSIRLRELSAELAELLELAGLAVLLQGGRGG